MKRKSTMLNSTVKKLYVTALLAASLAGTACTTLSGGDDHLTAAKSTVVTQAGRSEPVVSGFDRPYWVDLRGKNGAMPKMNGALATGEAQAAIDLARDYLAKRPGDADGLTMMAAALVLSRNYDLAAYYASLVEKARPNDAFALNVKGIAAMQTAKPRMADFRRATQLFQQAFDADPRQIAAGLNLGAVQLELGNATMAEQTFGQVSKRCEECNVALMGYGLSSARAGHMNQAKVAFEAVLKKNPSHSEALYQLALVQKNGYNNSKQAEKYLSQLLADPKIKNVATRERAQSVLRSMNGEASHEERTKIAKGTAANDAELLMTGTDLSTEDE